MHRDEIPVGTGKKFGTGLCFSIECPGYNLEKPLEVIRRMGPKKELLSKLAR